MSSCYFTETVTIVTITYLSLPFQFSILPETTMTVTKDTVTISEQHAFYYMSPSKHSVQLKDADPSELQLFIDTMPATIKGKSVKYGF